MATTAPVIGLALGQVDVSWVDTGESRHARRSISAFFVGSTLAKRHYLLLWEVCDVVHAHSFTRSGRLHDLRSWSQNVTLVGSHLTTGGIDIHVVLDLVPIRLLRFVVLIGSEEVDLMIHI